MRVQFRPAPQPELLQFTIHLPEALMRLGPYNGMVPRAAQEPAPLLNESVNTCHDIALRPGFGNFEHSEPNPPKRQTAHPASYLAAINPVFLPSTTKPTSLPREHQGFAPRLPPNTFGDLEGSESPGQRIDRDLFSNPRPNNQSPRLLNRSG